MSKESTQEVQVDQLIHGLVVEADKNLRKAVNDQTAARRQLDDAQRAAVYWQGRADSLRELLKQADLAIPKQADAATTSPLPPSASTPEKSSAPTTSTPAAATAAASTPIGRGRRSSRQSSTPE